MLQYSIDVVGPHIQPFSAEAFEIWHLVQENVILVAPKINIQPFSEEYLSFVVEVEMCNKLKQQCWIIQEEIDDLQDEVFTEIYGNGFGGDAN